MSDVLNRIIARKTGEVALAKSRVSEKDLEEEARRKRSVRPFRETLSNPGRHGANIIAEIKRGSPSKGLMRPDLDARLQAGKYELGGAAAISVLTDASFFHGSAEDLQAARASVKLPVLRKDFIVTAYQVYETAAMGADAMLLIVRALVPESLKDLLDLCGEVGLDPLVEVHSAAELRIAREAGATLIGINNRDLSTFHTDIQTSIDLTADLDADCIAVAESGIHGRDQIERLLDAGIYNFLIGESLVKAQDPEKFLGVLLGRGNRMQ